MPKVLFPEFLNDPRVYQEAEAYWQRMWHEIVSYLGAVHEWRSPWFANQFANGAPCKDGNPIFSAINNQRKLGVRVIQYAHIDEGEDELDWWIDFFGDRTDPDSIRELVVACTPTDRTTTQAYDLLYDWASNGHITITANVLPLTSKPILTSSFGRPELIRC